MLADYEKYRTLSIDFKLINMPISAFRKRKRERECVPGWWMRMWG